VNDLNDPANDKDNAAVVAIFFTTSVHKNTFALFTDQRYGIVYSCIFVTQITK